MKKLFKHLGRSFPFAATGAVAAAALIRQGAAPCSRKKASTLSDARKPQNTLIWGWDEQSRQERIFMSLREAIVRGGGALYLNMHGDVGAARIASNWAEASGRLQDVRVLNFGQTERQEATGSVAGFNPFARMAPYAAAYTLLGNAETLQSRSGSSLRGRAFSMHQEVFACLFWLRDQRGMYVDAKVIQDHLEYEAVVALSLRQDLPGVYREVLRKYLSSLPDDKDKAVALHQTLQMQSVERLNILTNVYHDIFCSGKTDIAFEEALLNRLLVYVVMPSLYKSQWQVEFLSSVMVSSLKSALDTLYDTRPDTLRHGMSFSIFSTDAGLSACKSMCSLCYETERYGLAIMLSASSLSSLKGFAPDFAESIIPPTNTKVVMRPEI